jgi:hypothetical protein
LCTYCTLKCYHILDILFYVKEILDNNPEWLFLSPLREVFKN